jgi:hypothetical protein
MNILWGELMIHDTTTCWLVERKGLQEGDYCIDQYDSIVVFFANPRLN